MTLEQNIKAVIESCFSESKEEIQDCAVNQIVEVIKKPIDIQIHSGTNIPDQSIIPPMPQSHENKIKEHCQVLMNLFDAKVCSLYGDDNNRNEELNYYVFLGGCKVHPDGREDVSILGQGFSLWGGEKE